MVHFLRETYLLNTFFLFFWQLKNFSDNNLSHCKLSIAIKRICHKKKMRRMELAFEMRGRHLSLNWCEWSLINDFKRESPFFQKHFWVDFTNYFYELLFCQFFVYEKKSELVTPTFSAQEGKFSFFLLLPGFGKIVTKQRSKKSLLIRRLRHL